MIVLFARGIVLRLADGREGEQFYLPRRTRSRRLCRHDGAHGALLLPHIAPVASRFRCAGVACLGGTRIDGFEMRPAAVTLAARAADENRALMQVAGWQDVRAEHDYGISA